MKRFLTLLMFLILIVSVGCNQEQPITQLEVGRDKLLGAGLAIEAIEHLTRAEAEEAKTEAEKVEPRSLLLVAYTYALLTGDAKTQGLADTYTQERNKRLPSVDGSQMMKLLHLLDERHRTQTATTQILIDRGAEAVPILIQTLGRKRFANIQGELVEMLYEIGAKGLGNMFIALRDANTPPNVKVNLVRLVGRINDAGSIPDLESLRSSSDAGLKMEINTALYGLGQKGYRSEIVAGLSNGNPLVRRAAAKAMRAMNDFPTDEIVKALKDSDGQVRVHAAQTLEKFPTPKAINPLIDILKNKADEKGVKQAAKDALIVHGQQAFGKNLARLLIKGLPRISEPDDRIRIVHLLKSDALQEQIKASPAEHDDNIGYDLYQYYSEKEQNDMVKEELSGLLNALDQ